MNPIESTFRRLDVAQQRHRPSAFVYGVMKKFGDDNGGVLVSNLAYSAFVAIFPLLLLLVTVLGIVLAHDPSARSAVEGSVITQFPLIGTQLLHNVSGLHRAALFGLVVGILGLVWGSTGLAQAGLFAMAQVWNIPGTARPNYVKRLGRSLWFLGVLGLGLLVTTALSGYGTFGRHNSALGILGEVLSALVNVGVFFLVYRALTPKQVKSKLLAPGAVVAGIGWTVLQAAGGYVVGHYLKNDSALYGTFGLVLGLVAWVYLGVELVVYAAEVNAVKAYQLWPRGLVQPPLTPADEASMALQATQNERRPEQSVTVSFSPDAVVAQGRPGAALPRGLPDDAAAHQEPEAAETDPRAEGQVEEASQPR